jgi:glycosyltransferase involved in cell wall biosynthesis
MNVDCVVIGINTEGTLRACLESITASRYDTGSVTVYYVDGGSRDGSVEIARSVPDVRVIELRDPYPSPGKGRNAGWQAGTGDVVQFLDSDTVLAPDWLSAAVGMLEQDPDVAAVRGPSGIRRRVCTTGSGGLSGTLPRGSARLSGAWRWSGAGFSRAPGDTTRTWSEVRNRN